jgi:hypothetical protein
MIRGSIFLLFWGLGFSALHGQNCTLVLSGVVQDKGGNVLPGATVLLSGKAIVTSANGTFEFQELCPGRIELTVRYIGYQESQFEIGLPLSEQLVVTLIPSETTLDAVEVSGNITHSGLTNATYRLTQGRTRPLRWKIIR